MVVVFLLELRGDRTFIFACSIYWIMLTCSFRADAKDCINNKFISRRISF